MTVDTSKSVPAHKQYGLEPGARTPQESAQMKTANAASEQNANNQKAGYKKRRKYKGGRGDQPAPGTVVVPQPTSAADPAGPVDANANTKHGTGTLTESAANAEYDNQVGKGGGKRKNKNTSQIGCSKRRGGKKRSYRKKRTTRKRKSLRKKRKVTRKKRTNRNNRK